MSLLFLGAMQCHINLIDFAQVVMSLSSLKEVVMDGLRKILVRLNMCRICSHVSCMYSVCGRILLEDFIIAKE